MLVDLPAELVLRIVNHDLEVLPRLEIEILESAEYHVHEPNPSVVEQLAPESPRDVTFVLRPKVKHRIAVNYRINGELRDPPLYINVIEDNPYVYGPPIHSSDSFFGRQAELEDIVQAVSKPNKQDILLVGERRTGKSSLLYQVQSRLKPPFVPVYAVLNEAEANVGAIIKLLCARVIGALVAQKVLPSEPWNHHECSLMSLTDNLKSILDAARVTRGDVKVVLLLDEADYILRVEDRLQNVMRAAFQSREVGADVRVVVAGTTDLSAYVSERSSPFFNHFRFVPLTPLSAEETADLIVRPAKALAYEYEEVAVARIAEACGGHPYYCQRICYEAFTLAVDTHQPNVRLPQAEAAVRKVVSDADAYNGFVTGFWQPSGPREPLTRSQKQFLGAVARGKRGARLAANSIKRLLDWQLIRQKDDAYEFTCELFREWIKRASGG